MKVALEIKFQEEKEILEAAMKVMGNTVEMINAFKLLEDKMKRYNRRLIEQEGRSIPEGGGERCVIGRAALPMDLSSEDTTGEQHEDRKKDN
ncbi:hypothetical protein [Kistimonas asteriae]|uniref:hypothetical protein n=1 Tax=Kistimonas asteriae TaxID=517724 RepID=UPI001BAE4695|nr:hypothetical protein [Kistimonas asteriae]